MKAVKKTAKAKKSTKKALKPVSKKKFGRMTAAQKRVAIAKDVIAQIEAKKYKATPGVYVEVRGRKKETHEDDYGLSLFDFAYRQSPPSQDVWTEDAKKVLENASKCFVCGIGAAVCSAVRVFDKVTIGDINDDMRGVLGEYFSLDQQRAIEGTFEQDDFGPVNLQIAAIESPTKRLTAIFQNIVDNKGTFTLT